MSSPRPTRLATSRVGEIRPSQLLHTYGVGSIVDLPHFSVVVLGLDSWAAPAADIEITEERLLGLVRSHLGSQVEKLCLPPLPPDDRPGRPGPFDEASKIGVPVTPFPRWMRCPRCRLIAPLESGLFELKREPYRIERTRYVHANCSTPGRPPAVLPARFVVACAHGHLDDFPWVHFVHRGAAGCGAALRLSESGPTAEVADVFVRCDGCGKSRPLVQAFGEDGHENLPPCGGLHPHRRDRKPGGCSEEPRAMLAGASNLWFAISVSALAMPRGESRLEDLVDEHWPILRAATSREILVAFRDIGKLPTFAEWSIEEIWSAVERRRARPEESPPKKVGDLKFEEWGAFARPAAAGSSIDFSLREVPPPTGFEGVIERVVLAERLRVVSAFLGFTRISSPRDFGDVAEIPEVRRAPLARRPPPWVPAAEVRGEGIFVLFREDAVARWTELPGAGKRARRFVDAHTAFRRARGVENPEKGFPGLRYMLLHTIAHALVRELALECGYSAASLQERIYGLSPAADGGPMAGILIYTAAADSEGTLGGLVSLGESKALGRHLGRALERLRLCTSDPLCAEHDPEAEPLTLNGAACHGCLFVSETSCERGNRYLDRSLAVETVAGSSVPFFSGVRGE